jgi:hypothetical protein
MMMTGLAAMFMAAVSRSRMRVVADFVLFGSEQNGGDANGLHGRHRNSKNSAYQAGAQDQGAEHRYSSETNSEYEKPRRSDVRRTARQQLKQRGFQ